MLFKRVLYLSIFCNKRAKRNNRVSLTKCMWDSCEQGAERKVGVAERKNCIARQIALLYNKLTRSGQMVGVV